MGFLTATLAFLAAAGIASLLCWLTWRDLMKAEARDEYEWWMSPVVEHDVQEFARRSQV